MKAHAKRDKVTRKRSAESHESIPPDLRLLAATIAAAEAAADLCAMAAMRWTPAPWVFQNAARRLSEAMGTMDGDDLKDAVATWWGHTLAFTFLGYEEDLSALTAAGHFARDVHVLDVQRHRNDDPIVWAMASMQAIRQRLGGRLTELQNLHRVYAAMQNERKTLEREAAQKTPGRGQRSMTREQVEPFVAGVLSKRPTCSAKDVAAEFGCSKTLVLNTTAWKVNQKRLAVARRDRVDPLAVPLNIAGVTESGGSAQRQRHDQKTAEDARDTQADIKTYLGHNPAAGDEAVMNACTCTRDEVALARLTLEQEADDKT